MPGCNRRWPATARQQVRRLGLCTFFVPPPPPSFANNFFFFVNYYSSSVKYLFSDLLYHPRIPRFHKLLFSFLLPLSLFCCKFFILHYSHHPQGKFYLCKLDHGHVALFSENFVLTCHVADERGDLEFSLPPSIFIIYNTVLIFQK